MDQCDGLVLSTADAYESEAIVQITKWQKELSREVYTFGPLLPTGANAAAGEQKQSEKAEEISRFLDKTLEADGPNSLLYVNCLFNCAKLRNLTIVSVCRFPLGQLSGQRLRRRFGPLWMPLWRKTYHS